MRWCRRLIIQAFIYDNADSRYLKFGIKMSDYSSYNTNAGFFKVWFWNNLLSKPQYIIAMDIWPLIFGFRISLSYSDQYLFNHSNYKTRRLQMLNFWHLDPKQLLLVPINIVSGKLYSVFILLRYCW